MEDKVITERDQEFIRDTCFLNHMSKYILPIGAPSSPIISNIIMYPLDVDILKQLHSIDGNTVYTRYADDLIISTHTKGLGKTVLEKIEYVLSQHSHPTFVLNKSKTIFSSKKNCRMITGLIITSNNKISIGRAKKRFIKKLIFDYKSNIISEEDLKYLQGYLCFISDNEPDFLNSMYIKYGSSILDKIRTAR